MTRAGQHGFFRQRSNPTGLGISIVLLAIAGCAPDHDALTIRGATMGTGYTVKLADCPTVDCIEDLQTRIDQRLSQINARMSTYDPVSELSQFNAFDGTDWINVSTDLYTVIDHALRVSDLTDGAFDISVGALVDAWGFGPAPFSGALPAPEVTQELQAVAGYRNIETRPEPRSIRKLKPGLTIDLSAIAKGYAVDEIARLLDKQRIAGYLVEIGGELRAKGTRGDLEAWRVAIEHPNADQSRLDNIIELIDVAIATSGDYRNFYRRDGQRYSHTIDPDSGGPVDHELAAVSVIDESAMHADALATALMVLGPERGLALAMEQNLAAAFVVRDSEGYRETMTPRFEQFLAQP